MLQLLCDRNNKLELAVVSNVTTGRQSNIVEAFGSIVGKTRYPDVGIQHKMRLIARVT